MNGRRARHIRRLAVAECARMGTPDRGGYQPETVRGRGGVRAVFPERRLMPGSKSLARQIRRVYVRTGMYPTIGVRGRD